MKFAEMSWGVLLILPLRFFALLAKPTLVAFAGPRDEPIVRLVGLKTTGEIYLVNLFAFEDTKKGLCGYTVLECCWRDMTHHTFGLLHSASPSLVCLALPHFPTPHVRSPSDRPM